MDICLVEGATDYIFQFGLLLVRQEETHICSNATCVTYIVRVCSFFRSAEM